MADANLYITIAAAALAAIALLASVGLRGFRAWLDLKRAELDAGRNSEGTTSTTSRIEIADLKERIRKLEAIAAGVDL